MSQSLKKLIGIYPGEERSVLWFALLGYLWMFAAASGLKFADVLFLVHIGADELPTVYTLNACGMIVLASLWITAFERLSSVKVSSGIICGGIVLYLAAFLCVHSGMDARWLWYALRIAAYLFFTVVITAYWIFVDQYHHIRDAKRLYCLFSSAIFGGSAMTGLVMRSGLFSIDGLLLLVLLTLCAVLLLLHYIAGRSAPVYDEVDGDVAPAVRQSAVMLFLRGILKSPYALLLMVNCFLIELFTWTTEYSYFVYFEEHFTSGIDLVTGEDAADSELAQVLGQLIMGVGLTNLVFGLFFFNKIVRRFGIYSLMPVSPLLLFFAFSNWLHTEVLLFPVIGFFVVEGTRWVIDDNGFNLLLSGVPSRLKYQVRVATEHFFEPIAMLASGILLGWMEVDSKLLSLSLAGVCLLVTFALRAHYLPAIFTNLRAGVLRLDLSVRQRWEKMRGRERDESFQALQRLLKSPDSDRRLLACQAALELGKRSLLPDVLLAGASLDEERQLKWMQHLDESPFASDPTVIDALRDAQPNVVGDRMYAEIRYFLARQNMLGPYQVQQDLESPDLMYRAAAIIAIRYAETVGRGHPRVPLERLAQESLAKMLDSEETSTVLLGLRVIGDSGTVADVARLLPLIKYGEASIAAQATRAVAKVIDRGGRRYSSTLLGILRTRKDTRVRRACLESLGKLEQPELVNGIIDASKHFRPSERRAAEEVIAKLGLRCVPHLLVACRDAGRPDACRLLAAQALGRLSPELLRENLPAILSADISRAYDYLYYHHTLSDEEARVDIAVIRETLMAGYYASLDIILHVLGIAGSLEDWELLSTCVRSRSARVRSSVLEALEKTCDHQLFRRLEPLIEDIGVSAKLKACEEQGCKPLQVSEILATMAQSSRLSDRVVASAHMRQLDLPHWRKTLQEQMDTDEEIFHHFAYELLDENA